MRLLVVCENIFSPAVKISGMKNIYRLQCELAKKDIEVHVLTSVLSSREQNWQKWYEVEKCRTGIHFHYVVTDLDHNSVFRFLKTKSFFLRKAVQLHKKYRFDLVHSYSSSPRLISFTALERFLLNIPSVHTLSGYNKGFFDSINAIFGISNVDKIVCGSKDIRRSLIKSYVHLQDNIVYIPLGFSESDLQREGGVVVSRRSIGVSESDPIILYLGPLEHRKGPLTLARCVSKVVQSHPNVHFLFATYPSGGANPQYSSIKNQIKTLAGTSNNVIIIEGQFNIASIMSLCDIFVLPLSNVFGTHAEPLTLLEAQYFEKPIIVSDVKGIRDLISDEETGLLFPPNDSDALSNQLIRLLGSENLREQLAKRTFLDERYKVSGVANNLFSLYTKLVNRCS